MKTGLKGAPLNLQPIGLLGFLGIKNGGEYPQELVNVLSPTWDLMRHYTALNSVEIIATTAGTTGVITPGSTIPITGLSPADLTIVTGGIQVPNNECWYLEYSRVTAAFPAEAAAYGDFAWAVTFGAGAATIPGVLAGFTTGSATGSRGVDKTSTDGFWVRPGSRLILTSIGSNSVLNTAVVGQLRAARFFV